MRDIFSIVLCKCLEGVHTLFHARHKEPCCDSIHCIEQGLKKRDVMYRIVMLRCINAVKERYVLVVRAYNFSRSMKNCPSVLKCGN